MKYYILLNCIVIFNFITASFQISSVKETKEELFEKINNKLKKYAKFYIHNNLNINYNSSIEDFQCLISNELSYNAPTFIIPNNRIICSNLENIEILNVYKKQLDTTGKIIRSEYQSILNNFKLDDSNEDINLDVNAVHVGTEAQSYYNQLVYNLKLSVFLSLLERDISNNNNNNNNYNNIIELKDLIENIKLIDDIKLVTQSSDKTNINNSEFSIVNMTEEDLKFLEKNLLTISESDHIFKSPFIGLTEVKLHFDNNILDKVVQEINIEKHTIRKYLSYILKYSFKANYSFMNDINFNPDNTNSDVNCISEFLLFCRNASSDHISSLFEDKSNLISIKKYNVKSKENNFRLIISNNNPTMKENEEYFLPFDYHYSIDEDNNYITIEKNIMKYLLTGELNSIEFKKLKTKTLNNLLTIKHKNKKDWNDDYDYNTNYNKDYYNFKDNCRYLNNLEQYNTYNYKSSKLKESIKDAIDIICYYFHFNITLSKK